MDFQFLDQFEGRDDPMIDRAGEIEEDREPLEELESEERQDDSPLETNL